MVYKCVPSVLWCLTTKFTFFFPFSFILFHIAMIFMKRWYQVVVCNDVFVGILHMRKEIGLLPSLQAWVRMVLLLCDSFTCLILIELHKKQHGLDKEKCLLINKKDYMWLLPIILLIKAEDLMGVEGKPLISCLSRFFSINQTNLVSFLIVKLPLTMKDERRKTRIRKRIAWRC